MILVKLILCYNRSKGRKLRKNRMKKGKNIQRENNENGQKQIAQNRKARHDYHLMDRFEAGVVLLGTEVKSIRAGHLSLIDSYAKIDDGEVFLHDAHIATYEYGTHDNHEPKRPRKLLLNRKEIRRLASKTNATGITVIPTRAYFSRGRVKVEIALARGKQNYDKREELKKQDDQRMMQRYLRR